MQTTPIQQLLASSLQPHFRGKQVRMSPSNKTKHSRRIESIRNIGGSYSSHVHRRDDFITTRRNEVLQQPSLAQNYIRKQRDTQLAIQMLYEGSGVFNKESLLFSAIRTPKTAKFQDPLSNAFNQDNKFKFNKLLSKTSNITITQHQQRLIGSSRAKTRQVRRDTELSKKLLPQQASELPEFYGFNVRKAGISVKNETTGTSAQKRFSYYQKRQVSLKKIKPIGSTKSKSQKHQKLLHTAYDSRLSGYRHLISTLHYCNSVYVDTMFPQRLDTHRVEVYVGGGNNSQLVKKLLKKRWWLHIAQSNNATVQFLWTQLKNKDFILRQRTSLMSPLCQDVSEIVLPVDTNKSKIVHRKDTPIQSPRVKNVNLCGLPLQDVVKRKQKIKLLNNMQYVHNHLQFSQCIGNKKSLLKCLLCYYQFNSIPKWSYSIPFTMHIPINGQTQFSAFLQQFKCRQQTTPTKNTWLVKPGENSNRGKGISVLNTIERITDKLKSRKRSYVVQEYIQNMLLYNGRKFDIRVYCLLTQLNGVLRAYWYEQGYIRTSSQLFAMDDLSNDLVHLTNDAVQKHGPNYGKHEPANKVSFDQFESYLIQQGLHTPQRNINELTKNMKSIVTDVIKSSYSLIDSNCRQNNFELFGVDFIVDTEFKVWLLQFNTNPCLELCSDVLERLIPKMLDNALTIALDPLLPLPPNSNKQYFPQFNISNNRFQLIFDSQYDRDLKYEEFLKIRMASYGNLPR